MGLTCLHFIKMLRRYYAEKRLFEEREAILELRQKWVFLVDLMVPMGCIFTSFEFSAEVVSVF